MPHHQELILPDYISDNWQTGVNHPILHTPAAELHFPLSADDERDIEILEAKFDQEQNMVGVAGPQIGIAKRVIVFAAPENPELQKFRKDFTQFMSKTIWLNPSYKGIGEEMSEDYEACFSIDDLAALVPRFKKIKYQAYDREGHFIEGEAEGFLARVIQHETDHVDGILCIEKAIPGSIMSIEAYREKRRRAIENE